MKWVYYRSTDELRGWDPSSRKPVAATVVADDIEILIDEDGRIQEIVIARASKKNSLEEIKDVAENVE